MYLLDLTSFLNQSLVITILSESQFIYITISPLSFMLVLWLSGVGTHVYSDLSAISLAVNIVIS